MQKVSAMTLSKHKLELLAIGAAVLMLGGCATGGAAYEPIVDGPKNAQYAQDLSECQQLAEQREYLNGDTQTKAAVGAVAGGLIGLSSNNRYRGRRGSDGDAILAGAIVGAILGGGSGALNTREERKHIVLNCVAGRGYRVLG